ncbi:MAG TPA: sulfite exporter TauE/SafE family protein [Acidimicrobiia bacterium]|nr:sulfite exporter TauE/SafE family protein [Acidimicrobiia bacterium]
MRALLASPLGFLIGLSLGALGGGGSILAVPALVYVAGQDPKEAVATSLVIVATVSLFGLVAHWRAGRVRVQAGVAFSAAGVAGSLVGSAANGAVDPDVLLLAFAAVMVVAAVAMVRRPIPRERPAPAGGTRLATRERSATVVKVLVAGSFVGLMTGFFGVGGGFVIVPALVLALRFPMRDAVGTSLLVIAINALVALAARLGSGHLQWEVIVPFVVAGVGGVLTGSRLAAALHPDRLVRALAVVLVVVAAYTAIDSALAL